LKQVGPTFSSPSAPTVIQHVWSFNISGGEMLKRLGIIYQSSRFAERFGSLNSGFSQRITVGFPKNLDFYHEDAFPEGINLSDGTLSQIWEKPVARFEVHDILPLGALRRQERECSSESVQWFKMTRC
jgi:hypothetical protein